MAYSLYMHINKINGCRYIGISTDPKRRWHGGCGYRGQKRFNDAIKKYGFNGFYHVIVATNLSKENAELMEQEYIRLYRANDPKYGYNIENGGRYGKMSDCQKEHIRQLMTGRKQSEETKNKRSKSLKKRDYSFMIGRKLPDSVKQKMSEKKVGSINPRSRSIEKYTLDGEFVARYETMNDAARSVGINSTSHISCCCAGKRNKCAGYVWKYAEVNDGQK